MFCVFLAENGLICRDAPIDAKAVIKNRDATICLRMIEIITFVLEHSHFTQHNKAVGKTFGNEKLTMIILRQFYGYVLSKCGTAFTNIDSDIENCSLYTAYQFALRKWRTLEVQPTHHTV